MRTLAQRIAIGCAVAGAAHGGRGLPPPVAGAAAPTPQQPPPPTRCRASLHQGDGAGPLADCAPLWRCLRWSRSRTRPAGARCRGAPLVEGAGGQQQFRHCWGSAPLPQSALCSAPPMGAHLSLQQRDSSSSLAAPTGRRASLHQGDGAGPLADCAPLWRCLRWAARGLVPLEHAAAALLSWSALAGSNNFATAERARRSRSRPRAVRRRWARTCRCSRTTHRRRMRRRLQHLLTRTLRAGAITRSEDAALVRTGRELAPTSAARRNKPLSNMFRRPRAEADESVQERGGMVAAPQRLLPLAMIDIHDDQASVGRGQKQRA